ncbi:hypothetical protein NAEGRDRAFT_58103 [Naegleria gruberi]|uniref:Uncharacterized protein n=1 Tax=Naegleria gruberi TaxID=5762 RepID=D2VG07_NAEGR|nr:uncharacterized protein NAEGRDRAFT_58103 [Naegleria gruberi]EFC44178.1 hypothetical protein NAEGRDRAFT_58103 [Naegleria gruberi]|eukprot:XP_002676922.1 hypothetical protein NAEGRDRAFT_58103 [Naegleria gruberi strain NEG-M]
MNVNNQHTATTASTDVEHDHEESETISVISVIMPNIHEDNSKRELDYSNTKHQYKQCDMFGRKHDFQCGKNVEPKLRKYEVEPFFSTHNDSKYQKSLKRMSPKQTTGKIKKEKHRMRTSKITTIALSPVVEKEEKENETLNQEDTPQPEQTNLNSVNKENEKMVIDSTTSFDVFMIMFLVGLYTSRKYGQKHNSNS